MGDTKEAILTTALQLFAGNGYEAVSVSEIAGALGMTKGALYKHYKNKRDIFDHILIRMEQRDAEQAGNCEMPEGTLEEMEEQYQDISMEQFFTYCKEQFTYWTEDTFAASFRRMLTLEQFRSEEMQKLYQQYLVAGPMEYVADLFTSSGVRNARAQAVRLYATMFFFYSVYDGAEDKESAKKQFQEALKELEKHDIDCPYRHKMASKKETNNFYKDLDTTDIRNRLISCLNRMLKKVFNNMDGNGLLVRGEKKSKNNFFDFNGNGGERKYLPHKNFNSGNLKEDMDIQKIYYGKCALYIYKYIPKGGADIKMYYLKILSRNSKKQICEISISPYVYNYLSNELTDIPEERDEALNYYLCFSGILEKNKYSYKCKLKDSRLLVLEKK